MTKDKKIRGVIYCYTCMINNKKYIGQTTNEEWRKAQFRWKTNYCKGGQSAIDNARRKHGVKNFKYEVLEVLYFDTKEEARNELDRLEILYIEKFNSYLVGYNSTKGGHTQLGHKWTEEQRARISGVNHHNWGKKFPYKEHKKSWKPILVYNKNGVLIDECPSQKDAAQKYNIQATNIAKVCRGKLNSTGGLVFKYKKSVCDE